MYQYRKDYPRPQLSRKIWTNLNGEWEFLFDDSDIGERSYYLNPFQDAATILVPYSYETKMSGIGDESYHPHIWYRRLFQHSVSAGKRTILHFEGSDYLTKVWINGSLIGCHSGGYERFSFDITKALIDGDNIITVKVSDSFDESIPRGKQRWRKESFGCWYVQTTGIWKTVWLEEVPDVSIRSVKMTPDVAGFSLALEVDISNLPYYDGSEKPVYSLKAEVSFGSIYVNQVTIPVTSPHIVTNIDVYSTNVHEFGIRTWAPEHPDLYDITFTLIHEGIATDVVDSYFGMRMIEIKDGQILLNGFPLYQRLILDQGYWKDSHLTPPSEDELIKDLDMAKQLGYNGVRKHQKTEDERFLYWADVKGMIIWGEMPSAYRFHDDAIQNFTEEWTAIVRQNYNHPSIITWTPFNESWGILTVKENRQQQHFTECIYHLTKSLDSMRPVIVNDGWEHTVSDILTLHDYQADGLKLLDRYRNAKDEITSNSIYANGDKSAFADGYSYQGQPIIISEFGGIALNNEQAGWGYGDRVQGEEAFLERFESITHAIQSLPYVCGFCYTQLTDVQQEINGLLDMDRNFKVNPERIREINIK